MHLSSCSGHKSSHLRQQLIWGHACNGIHTHGVLACTHICFFHEDFWGETQCRTQLQVTFPLYGTPHSEGNSLSGQKPTAPLVEVMPVLCTTTASRKEIKHGLHEVFGHTWAHPFCQAPRCKTLVMGAHVFRAESLQLYAVVVMPCET